MTQPRRLIVASNRLPIVMEHDSTGERRIVRGSGGLITAIDPILKNRGGRWVGWLGPASGGSTPESLAGLASQIGYDLAPVELTAEEVTGYYGGFSNQVLWPLFHDFIDHCKFVPAYWPLYRSANRKFAESVARGSTADDYVWIHDYQLLLVARELRRAGVEREMGYFLHIPFPPLDMLEKMPWRTEILDGLLGYDLVGFQTPRDVRNFIQCVRHRVRGAEIEDHDDMVRIRTPERTVYAKHFPISIDYDDFVQRSVEHEVSEMVARLRAQLPSRFLLLGLDRLDYSKGIPERILAFGNALERHPELREKVTLIQVVVPSRTRVDDYRNLKDEIDRLIGLVNGTYSRAGWTPIHYTFRALAQTELLAYYRVCDAALVTPLKDGMNLVAKEYCACSLENRGVLILSEFAGAAEQLAAGSLIVNPFDIEQTANAIHQAATMTNDDRIAKMSILRSSIREQNIYRWVDQFLEAAERVRVLGDVGSSSG